MEKKENRLDQELLEKLVKSIIKVKNEEQIINDFNNLFNEYELNNEWYIDSIKKLINLIDENEREKFYKKLKHIFETLIDDAFSNDYYFKPKSIFESKRSK